jgi:cephalosporin hydroxylase
MKLIIDNDAATVTSHDEQGSRTVSLHSREGFEAISREWVRAGWSQKYSYTFTWLGRPIIQLPEDMIRTQEVIFSLRPDVIIETGVAHGGSLIYYASLCRLLGKGRVVGIDIEIREQNRQAIESHFLAGHISLLVGSSTDPKTVAAARAHVREGETVLVILDSNHTRQHVLDELHAYHSFVTPGSYIVATDGIMYDLHDVPGGQPHWKEDNPVGAVHDFLAENSNFELEQPAWLFNESPLGQNVTHWPSAWLRRKTDQAV